MGPKKEFISAGGSIRVRGRMKNFHRSLGWLFCNVLATDWCVCAFFLTTQKMIRGGENDTKSKLGYTNSQLCNNRYCLFVCVRMCVFARAHLQKLKPVAPRHLLCVSFKYGVTDYVGVQSILPPHRPSARTSWLGCHCIACVSPCLCDISVFSQPFGLSLPLCASSFPPGMGKKDDPKLMQEWFKLVQEKNALVRYESELMIL